MISVKMFVWIREAPLMCVPTTLDVALQTVAQFRLWKMGSADPPPFIEFNVNVPYGVMPLVKIIEADRIVAISIDPDPGERPQLDTETFNRFMAGAAAQIEGERRADAWRDPDAADD